MNDKIDEKIERLIERNSARYGKIFHVFPAETNEMANFSVPAFIIDCYSDRIFQEVTRYKREFIVIVRNGRITSFLAELFLLNYAHATGKQAISGIDLLDFAGLGAKKFVAITMNGIAESEMAGTLFLESVVSGQDGWLSLYGIRDGSPSLRAAYDHFSRVASEFIFHHEIGHEFVVDQRFGNFIDKYLDTYVASLKDLRADSARILRTEMFADLFSIHIIFVKYSKVFNEMTMRNMCEIAFSSVITAILLNNIANNLHKLNVDQDHIALDLDTEFKICQHRLAGVTRYIREFVFDAETTILCDPDAFDFGIGFVDALLPAILDGSKIARPVTTGMRGIFQALARTMFSNPGQMTRFIEETRIHRQIEKDAVAERFIREELTNLGGFVGS